MGSLWALHEPRVGSVLIVIVVGEILLAAIQDDLLHHRHESRERVELRVPYRALDFVGKVEGTENVSLCESTPGVADETTRLQILPFLDVTDNFWKQLWGNARSQADFHAPACLPQARVKFSPVALGGDGRRMKIE